MNIQIPKKEKEITPHFPGITQSRQMEVIQAIAYAPVLKELASPFLEHFGFSHIWISRFYYETGYYFDFSNDAQWKKIFTSIGADIDFIKNHIALREMQEKDSVNYHFWQDPVFDWNTCYNDVFLFFNVFSGLNIMWVRDGYIENLAFASPYSLPKISSSVNMLLKSVGLFYTDLLDRFFSCINPSQFCFGQLDFTFTPKIVSNDVNFLETRSYRLDTDGISVKLSTMQLATMLLLRHGYSQKCAADMLDIKPTTIQSYIQDIRRKFDDKDINLIIRYLDRSPLSETDYRVLLKKHSKNEKIV